MLVRNARYSGPAAFEITPVVEVVILETIETRGLVGRFMQWCSENGLEPVVTGGGCGGGSYVHGHAPGHAERIQKWLEAQGAILDGRDRQVDTTEEVDP